jgi:uncharacterized repeat protein (TIGR03803 family)
MQPHGNHHSLKLKSSSLFSTLLAVALAVAAVIMFADGAFAAERVIHNFQGGNDGIGPNDLIADRAGNLYGTTFNGGGSAGAGTVFELSPRHRWAAPGLRPSFTAFLTRGSTAGSDRWPTW